MPNLLRIPDRILTEAEDDANSLRVRFLQKEDALTVFLSSQGSRPTWIRLRWNIPAEPGIRILGDAWERSYGELHWGPVDPERIMPWYFLAAYPGDRVTGWGVAVRPNAMAAWTCDNDGVTLHLDVCCGTAGLELGDRELEVCTVLNPSYRGLSAYRAAKDFCRRLSPEPLLPDQPVYGGNNWYYAYGKSSRQEILSDADLQAELAQGLENRPFMVIDDGWQPNPTAGPWIPNEKFGDMKTLAQEMKDMGVRPGLWVRFLRDERPEIPAAWRLNRRNRRLEDPRFLEEGFLDPSHPEVLDFVRQTVERIVKDWGFELIKHDFSTFDALGQWGFTARESLAQGSWHFYDRTRTSAQILKDFYTAIREAAGDCLILGCNCVGHLLAGLAHLNRIGDDTSGVEWSRTRKMGINTLAFRLCQDGSFFSADADCVGICGSSIPWELNRQWAELLARSGTPLFLSCPQGVLDEEQIRFLRDCYARASAGGGDPEPLDWMDSRVPARYRLDGEDRRFCWFPDPEALPR